MRLIDGEALEHELTEQIKSEEKDGNYFNVESLDRAREYVIDAPTVQAIPIPDNATNGDVLKILFPNIQLSYDIIGNRQIFDNNMVVADDD